MKKDKYESVGFDDLLENTDNEPEQKKISKPKAAFAYLGAVLAVSLGVSSLMVPGGMAAAATVNVGADYYYSLSDDISFIEEGLPQHTILLDKNGKEFARVFAENRVEVDLDEISPMVPKALIAIEDSRFYTHGGIDITGTARAQMSNAVNDTMQGGSSITQQLVKTMLLLHAVENSDAETAATVSDRSYLVKLEELRMATAIEKEYTKDEILTMYLNTVYFGQGAYGIYAASHKYFGVEPSKLTTSQAAVLAGAVNAPNSYNPIDNMELAIERRDLVLHRMLVTGVIDQKEHDAAVEEKITVKSTKFGSGCVESKFPHYCDYVMHELKTNDAFGKTAELREARLRIGGMTITTALDPKMQKGATQELEAAMGEGNRVASAATTVEPGTGHIKSMAQSWEYGNGDYQTEINYGNTKFSVGSAFKPLVIAAALEEGHSPRATVFSSPSGYKSPVFDGPPNGYSNFGFYSYGPQDMYKATQMSVNVYFIKLMEMVGLHDVAAMSEKLGIVNLPNEFNGTEGSLALGAYELTPLEMATAFATFASEGMHCNPVAITQAIQTETGRELEVPDTNCQQVITPSVANGVSDILTHNFVGAGTAKTGKLNGREAAGKTGTTENFAETWFVGYTPQLSTAVWVGDPRGGQQYPLDVLTMFGRTINSATGEDIAAPLWKQVMERQSQGMPALKFPEPGASVVSSTPTSQVPNVIGMDVDKAVTLLTDMGFTPVISETAAESKGHPENTVVQQDPAQGSNLKDAGTVTLTLSTGSNTSIVIPEEREEETK